MGKYMFIPSYLTTPPVRRIIGMVAGLLGLALGGMIIIWLSAPAEKPPDFSPKWVFETPAANPETTPAHKTPDNP